MDRTASSNFLAGSAFGGALLFALAVFLIVKFIPIGHCDWRSFIKGALVTPVAIIVIGAMVVGVAWLTIPNNN